LRPGYQLKLFNPYIIPSCVGPFACKRDYGAGDNQSQSGCESVTCRCIACANSQGGADKNKVSQTGKAESNI
jgi:hypothetical protein